MVRGKGGKNRWVPVDADVARWVREFRPVGPVVEAGQPLFTNPSTGGVWKSTSRRKVMVAAMEQAGFETRPNEALRHCYGTQTAARLLGDGQGETDAIRLVMRMMGHTSHSSSERYVKLAASTLRRALRPVDD
jgi:integrase